MAADCIRHAHIGNVQAWRLQTAATAPWRTPEPPILTQYPISSLARQYGKVSEPAVNEVVEIRLVVQ